MILAEFIEREAAIKCAEKSYKMWNLTMAAADGAREINKCYKMQEICKAIVETFKIVPAADVVPMVHAHWVYGEFDIPRCSECGNDIMPNMISPYCPNCGAKMDEEATDGR